MKRYNPSEIEPKWQKIWEDKQVYSANDLSEENKSYIAGMFPYPSGLGLHVGHVRNYSIVDVIARFYRQLGLNVMNPIGWDTFGLPAENFAIKTGTSPQEATKINIENFKKQFKRLGVSVDWSREINTSHPEYYKWTQWVFTKLFDSYYCLNSKKAFPISDLVKEFEENGNKGLNLAQTKDLNFSADEWKSMTPIERSNVLENYRLAYRQENMQWWCPVDKTVLANEQVENGRCWRCGSEVEKKKMRQWFFRITAYADELLSSIDDLEWPEKIKTMQRNWIGKSEGAEIEFAVEDSDIKVKVFTTRPDTLYGATYIALAPEHKLVEKLVKQDIQSEVDEYIRLSTKKSEIERQENKEKTGVFTGSYVVNPANGKKMPIWIADYVLSGYGEGAIMAVPAHDERDFEFATKFELPIVTVIEPEFGKPAEDETEKEAIIAILRNPKDGKVLLLDWGERKTDHGGKMFIGGGIEKDENPIETAKREVIEETGYVDFKYVKSADTWIHNHFFSDVKNVNVKAKFLPIIFELQSDKKVATRLDDGEDRFELKWVDEKDLDKLVDEPAHSHGYKLVSGGMVYTGEGIMVNSDVLDGRSSSDVREELVSWLEDRKIGRKKVTYKMHDWLISRQRYWGAPIPIYYDVDGLPNAVSRDSLPVYLPDISDYKPDDSGRSALAKTDEFLNVEIDGASVTRETDTMDGYACSSWYLMRYCDPRNDKEPWNKDKVNYWMPLDFYVGGDHAVAHLLYVRFWAKFFRDMGLIDFGEPIKRLLYNGYINAEDGRKMSKSLGNVVDPLEIIDQGYGADTLRVYELFIGPYDLDASWDTRGIGGVYRFLSRVHNLVQEYLSSDSNSSEEKNSAILSLQHQTIKKVTEDLRRNNFNTAVAALMEYTNELYKLKLKGFSDGAWKEALESLVKLLAPFAPHLSSELFEQLGNTELLERSGWPKWDEKYLVVDRVEVVIQVNGKLRGKFMLATSDLDDEKLVEQKSLELKNVKSYIGNKSVSKFIYVKNRHLVNIVVK